jgi:hypothetical protein
VTLLTDTTANPRVAWIVIALVFALALGQGAWLESMARSNAALEGEGGRLTQSLARTKAHTEELRANEARIKILYARLKETAAVRSSGDLPLPEPKESRTKQTAEPAVVKDFRQNGWRLISNPGELGNLSVTYAAQSDQLEFHRLVPFVAQEENSNSLMVVDSLTLRAPDSTPPFSIQPTALNAQLSLRILALSSP